MKKFIISSKALKDALQKLGQAINSKSVIPSLADLCVRVTENSVKLIATDLELVIIIDLECEAAEPFDALLPFDFVKKVVGLAGNQPLVITLDGNSAKIAGEAESYELRELDTFESYPKLPLVPKKNSIELDEAFIRSLARAQATCANDDLRPALTRIYVKIEPELATMASTDAHGLYSRTFPVKSEVSDEWMISPRVAKALAGFDALKVTWNSNHLAFKCGNVEVIARQHDEKFPDYKAIFPSGPSSQVKVDRTQLMEALERACLTSDNSKTTVLQLRKVPEKIILECEDFDLSRKIAVEIDGKYDGDLEYIAVNASKLLTMMGQVDVHEVVLNLQTASKAMTFTAEDDKEYFGLLMPLMLNR